jgi:RHS repeat-associated protein
MIRGEKNNSTRTSSRNFPPALVRKPYIISVMMAGVALFGTQVPASAQLAMSSACIIHEGLGDGSESFTSPCALTLQDINTINIIVLPTANNDQLSLQLTRTSALPSGLDITGQWISYDYACGDSVYTQEISMTQVGNFFVAIKITGDPCVLAGDVTFFGAFTGILPNAKSLGSDCPGSCPGGNHIDIGSGNKYETVVDYRTAGPNQLSFARYYNSLAGSGTFAVALGNNWRSTYDRYLHLTSPSGVVTAVVAERANGQVLFFTKSGGNWISDADVDVQLAQTGGTSWTLIDHDDTVETYSVNGSGEGLLTSIQARNGYSQTLQYNASNQLISVTDTYNRTLIFAYANGLMQTVTTPDGLVLTYAYTAPGGGNVLTSVSYSTTPATSLTYLYENTSLPFALTGIVDEDGNRYATWSYDSYGRSLSSQHAGGADLTTVIYDDTTGNRTVANALGEQMLYKFTTVQNVPKVSEIDRMASSTTAAAKKTFTYDSNGYTASVTDWNGNLTTYVNDVHGQPTSITEASGTAQARTKTIAYLSNYHLPASMVTPGLTTTYTYDASGNLLTKTDTDTTSTTVPYSTNGTARVTTYTWANFLPASVQGPRTDAKELTTYTYDSTGALTATTNALNQTTKNTQHLPGGLPQTVIDTNGVTTNLAYDARNRLLSSTVVTAAGSLVTSSTYDAAGNIISVTQPDGSSLTNTYDAAHRLIGIADIFQESSSYTLDALNDRTLTNVADTTGKVQHTHSGSFDALGRMLQDIGGVGQTTIYTYDGNGNAVTITDPLNHQTQHAFDALNRPITTTDHAGNVTQTSYDAHDRIISATDPNLNTTQYIYDGFGDLIQQVSPTTGTTVYRYDLAGNLIQRVDARGVVANFTYDALDRVATTAYPGAAAENITYTYDQPGHGFGVGRLTSVADAAGTLSRSYDERGDVLSENRVQGGATLSTAYGYDAARRVVSVRYPSGLTASYVRDAMGRITGITAAAGGTKAQTIPVVSGVGYKPFGPKKALTFGNGIVETRTFDADYRETLLSDTGSHPFQNLIYAYDLANNVSSITDSVTAGNSQTFGYDSLNRLTSAAGAYGTLSYTYDAIGNRLSDNSLASPVLDGLGNINSLTYNQAGRVSVVTASSNQVAGYIYDAFGHRLVRSGANSALYQYDLGGHLLEETDGQGNPQVDYIYLGKQPIASVAPVSGDVYFLHDDRLGTPQVATDVNQVIQWTASYQPFGATNTGIGLIAQDLRLPGQEFDSVAGWNHNGSRDYIPGLGRYLESDPFFGGDPIAFSGGLNLYVYVRNNPVSRTDPLGLSDDSGGDNSGGDDATSEQVQGSCIVCTPVSVAFGIAGYTPGEFNPGSATEDNGNTPQNNSDVATSVATGALVPGAAGGSLILAVPQGATVEELAAVGESGLAVSAVPQSYFLISDFMNLLSTTYVQRDPTLPQQLSANNGSKTQ